MPFSLAIDAWSTSDVTAEEQGPEAPPLLRPAPLVKGDTIGVVAPSYAPREGWLHRGVKALERAGFGVIGKLGKVAAGEYAIALTVDGVDGRQVCSTRTRLVVAAAVPE